MKLNFTTKKGIIKPPVFVVQDGEGQPLATGAGAVYHYNPKITTAYSFEDRFGEEYVNCKVIGGGTMHPKVLLPRMKRPLGKEDWREDGDDINITMKMGPRNKEQESVLKCMKGLYTSGRSGYVINASTGFGKTYLGCYQISLVQKTTLVLIIKSDLEGQWRKSFKDFLGLDNSEIGLIKGDRYSIAGKKVVIGYVQSIMKDDRYPAWLYKYFGLVIVDEVHTMSADKFVNCMYLLPAFYRLGLSATTDRSDHKEHVFTDHIGPILITAENLPMPFNVIRVNTGVIPPEKLYFKPGRMMTLYTWLAKHQQRQKVISTWVRKCYDKDRTIICFADTRAHLDFAFNGLVDAGVKPYDIGRYHGGMTDEDLHQNATTKRVILATYKYTSMGTDYSHWDTAVFMTPRADVRQPVGRVVREHEGKKAPLVLDFVDHHGILLNFYKARAKWYAHKATKIREV